MPHWSNWCRQAETQTVSRFAKCVSIFAHNDMLEHEKLHSAFQHCRIRDACFFKRASYRYIQTHHCHSLLILPFFSVLLCVEWISAGTKPTAWSCSQRKLDTGQLQLTGLIPDRRWPLYITVPRGARWHQCRKCLLAKMEEVYSTH